jgi:Ca2+-binding EF-hand superfamily protein
MYRQLYPYSRSDKFCGRIFTIFDCNKDNYLDFGEFLRAIRITMRGDINEKLKCAFEIYDLKGDGKIDKREMKKTLNSIYDMLGEDNRRYRRNSKFAEKKVELIFQKYDTDKDNKLSLDEFINGCLNDEYLNQLLKSNFIMSN